MGDWPGVGGRQRQGSLLSQKSPSLAGPSLARPKSRTWTGTWTGVPSSPGTRGFGTEGDGQFIDRYATAGWQWQRPGDRLTPHSDPKCAIIAASHDPRQQAGKLPGDESNDEQQHGGGHGDSQQGCWPTSDLWPWLIELGHSPSGGTGRR